jgi:hypothetical protein
VPFLIVVGVVVLLCIALVVAVAIDPGPPPGEVAIAYELAWDRLDFDTLWLLSAPELRDHRNRDEFVRAKREAYADRRALAGLTRHVALEDVVAGRDAATARTQVELHDGTVVHNQVQLIKHVGRWLVCAYDLAPEKA